MPNYRVGPDLSNPVLSRFESLLYIPAPSSRESRIADAIRAQIESMGLVPRQDAGGNVWVELEGADPSLPRWLYAAHMDEICMVVTRIEDSGDLKVTRSGGLYPWKLGETPVTIVGDGQEVTGILSMGSMHIPEEMRKQVDWSEVWITTGLSPAELAAAGVRPGSHVVPHNSMRGPVVFGSAEDPLIASWTFDDRLGCALLLELLAQLTAEGTRPRHPSAIAFVHNEEIGGFGAKNLARKLQPEAFIAIDGAPMPPDTPLRMDHRPATWSRDSLAHYDHELLTQLLAAGQEVDVEVQTVVFERAASDASMAFASGLADRALCFGCVRGNSHGYEILRAGVLPNSLRTLHRFITTR